MTYLGCQISTLFHLNLKMCHVNKETKYSNCHSSKVYKLPTSYYGNLYIYLNILPLRKIISHLISIWNKYLSHNCHTSTWSVSMIKLRNGTMPAVTWRIQKIKMIPDEWMPLLNSICMIVTASVWNSHIRNDEYNVIFWLLQ